MRRSEAFAGLLTLAIIGVLTGYFGTAFLMWIGTGGILIVALAILAVLLTMLCERLGIGVPDDESDD